MIGSIQGAEALLVLGIGEPLIGRLLLYDALAGSFDEVAVRRDPAAPSGTRRRSPSTWTTSSSVVPA